MIELLAGLLLSLTAAVVGVWQVSRRDRPLHGPMDGDLLGLPRLQRWDTSYKPPRMQRLRSKLPRLEISPLTVILCILIVAAAGGALWYSRQSSESASRQEAFDTGMVEVASLRLRANDSLSQDKAWTLLEDARERLAEVAALETGAEHAERVAAEATAIAQAIDRVTAVTRLSTVQPVGAIPAAPAGVEPQLVAGGGKVYLLSDAVYQVETASATLVRLLGPGDVIGESEPVETLRVLAWRAPQLVVADATRAYALDPTTGVWSVEPLGTLDSAGHVDVRSADSYDRNLYLLFPDAGQILKFSAGLYDSAPEDWNGAVAREDLESAVDLAIDGHVFALLDDGRVLDFFRSRLERTLQPEVIPPVEQARAIVAPADAPYVYVLDADGRVLRVTRDGRLLQQLVPEDDAPSMAGATDLAVDEAAGIAWLTTAEGLYMLRLPAAPAVEQPASETPTPPPAQTPEAGEQSAQP